MNSNGLQSALISDILDPLAAALTPESASLLATLKADPKTQSRVDELAKKCNEGELSDAEQEEYRERVLIGKVLTVLKAKAKTALASPTR